MCYRCGSNFCLLWSICDSVRIGCVLVYCLCLCLCVVSRLVVSNKNRWLSFNTTLVVCVFASYILAVGYKHQQFLWVLYF